MSRAGPNGHRGGHMPSVLEIVVGLSLSRYRRCRAHVGEAVRKKGSSENQDFAAKPGRRGGTPTRGPTKGSALRIEGRQPRRSGPVHQPRGRTGPVCLFPAFEPVSIGEFPASVKGDGGRVVYRASGADWPLGDPVARGWRSRLWTESRGPRSDRPESGPNPPGLSRSHALRLQVCTIGRPIGTGFDTVCDFDG